MTAFRTFLIVYLACLVIYTGITIAGHGLNLMAVFFGDIAAMAWPGQFNFDFLGFLMLSALWVSWRHRFTAAGLGLGVLAFFGGMVFLCIYLLIVTAQAKGDMREVLLGRERTGG